MVSYQLGLTISRIKLINLMQATNSPNGPPPLENVVQLLGPYYQTPADGINLGIDRRVENEDMDYVAFGHHIQVFSVVLMNIPQYVEIDRRKSSSNASSVHLSPSKRAEAEKPLLKIVKELLDSICGKISKFVCQLFMKGMILSSVLL